MKTLYLTVGITALLLLGSRPAASQSSYVEGVSAIINAGTNSTQIETFSETFETADIAYYYEAYVEGYLYQNGSLIADGAALGSPYTNDAYGYMTQPLHVPDTYEIQSDHYLVAYYTSYDPNTGAYEYDNPDYFTNDGGYGGSNDFLPGSSGCGCYYETVAYIFLGTTAVQMSSAPPTISSISPTGVSLGDSGTLTINGSNLVDVFTQTATVSLSNSGITWSIGSQSATQVTINYSVSTSATTGSGTLTVSDRFGSSSATLNVGDGTPKVTSITPSTWNAGVTTSVTFGGNNFGTAPTLSFSSSQVTATIASASNTQIVANVTVATCAPAQTVTVMVQSHGYNGSGFIATSSGQSPDGTDSATIKAIAALAPTISFGGKVVSGTTTSVVVGQQIALTGNVPSQSCGVASHEWSTPTGTAVGGATASTLSGFSLTSLPSNTGSAYTFYWVYPGSSLPMTYKYTLTNGEVSPVATATFTVTGAGSMSNTSETSGKLTVDNLTGCTAQPGGPYLVYGNVTGPVPECSGTTSGSAGIVFTPSGAPSAGSYSYVQLLSTDTRVYRTATTTLTCTTTAGIDSSYPYAGIRPGTSPPKATDAPEIPLPGTYTTASHTFNATMYLLWKSNTSNSITVPLGYQAWQFSGSTTQSGGRWGTPTGGGDPVGGFVSSSGSQANKGYPTWSNKATQNPCQ